MATAVKITRMEHTAAELRDLAVKSRDAAQSRRLLAIAMVQEGSSRRMPPGWPGWIGKLFETGFIDTMRLARRV